jgi:hypothetical protein
LQGTILSLDGHSIKCETIVRQIFPEELKKAKVFIWDNCRGHRTDRPAKSGGRRPPPPGGGRLGPGSSIPSSSKAARWGLFGRGRRKEMGVDQTGEGPPAEKDCSAYYSPLRHEVIHLFATSEGFISWAGSSSEGKQRKYSLLTRFLYQSLSNCKSRSLHDIWIVAHRNMTTWLEEKHLTEYNDGPLIQVPHNSGFASMDPLLPIYSGDFKLYGKPSIFYLQEELDRRPKQHGSLKHCEDEISRLNEMIIDRGFTGDNLRVVEHRIEVVNLEMARFRERLDTTAFIKILKFNYLKGVAIDDLHFVVPSLSIERRGHRDFVELCDLWKQNNARPAGQGRFLRASFRFEWCSWQKLLVAAHGNRLGGEHIVGRRKI